jgi:NADP-dependent 3-hydroxy acid dehydrogenase YdfG
MELTGRVALITGSGRGIGRAIAQLFAKEGAAVFLTARTEKELSTATAEISGNGGCAAYAAADLTQEAECAHVVAACREKFGRIDILVNNAGHYGPVVPVEEYPLAEFDKVIAIHLRAAFLLSKLVLPEMYARKSGVILNISSLSAKAAYAWGSAYTAAKAGMLGLTRRPRHGNANVQGSGRGPRGKNGRKRRRTTGWFSERAAAGTRTDGGGNCARRAVPLFGTVQRDDRAIHQCRWRRGFLLIDLRGAARRGFETAFE